jgi:hypothetical protein
MGEKQKETKVCYICHKELDAKKDKDIFVEADGIVACKRHHGIEKWHEEAKDREEKALLVTPEAAKQVSVPESP